jgi:hypothetical protein
MPARCVDNAAVPVPTPQRAVATLWRLACETGEVSCVVYRDAAGLELRVESPAGTILSEPFDLQPKAMARTRALRASLIRRGWRELTPGTASEPPRN